jgi:hypothetical protein
MKKIVEISLLQYALVFVAIILMTGCSDSPEKAGEKLAQHVFECQIKKLESQLVAYKKLMSELDGSKVTTKEEYLKILSPIEKERQKVQTNCDDETKTLEKQLDVDFPKEEDRKTISNMFRAKLRQFREKEATKLQKLSSENFDLRNKISDLTQGFNKYN